VTTESDMPRHWPRIAVPLLLTFVTLVAYAPVLSNSFTNYDDPEYVTDNPHIRDGLTTESTAWALRATRLSNWHPLTWISHAADVELFGFSASGHHATSLIFHLVNALLLYFFLLRATGASWRSALVALLFAIHPLHVESVAWVSERKDVLSTCFWLLALLAYQRYLRSFRLRHYMATAVLMALGLMAKPMLVTLPATLLLIDYWPSGPWTAVRGRARLLLEKLPLFGLAAISAAITLIMQRAGHALRNFEEVSLVDRLANVPTSYCRYIAKSLWPVDLAVFYPLPREGVSLWQALAAFLLLGGVTAAAVCWRRSRPWFLWGWLWFVGTLVPVIGLVQVGRQAMADRYMYVPLIGLAVIAIWGGAELLGRAAQRSGLEPRRERALALALSVVLSVGLLLLTQQQVRVWRDSRTLFEHALAVTEGNYIAHVNLGEALEAAGDAAGAATHYERALAIAPSDPVANNNLGRLYALEGNLVMATRHLQVATRSFPEYALAHSNLGILWSRQGLQERAARSFLHAIELRPDLPQARFNWGTQLLKEGQAARAEQELRVALALRPDYGEAHANLAAALLARGELVGAHRHVEQARQAGVEPSGEFLRALEAAQPPRL
jgi:Flp pilus assembly protein TadD